MKYILLIVILVSISGFFAWKYMAQSSPSVSPVSQNQEYTYVPIGDSLTIGNDVLEEDRWPNVLTNHLQEEGVNITLLENPAVSGYTVTNALTYEVPVIERLKPNFVTILIGANDLFRQKELSLFQEEYKELLDRVENVMSEPKKIVLITIPDYTKSPALSGYQSEQITDLINSYNNFIKEEGEKRNHLVIDLVPISQVMTSDADYTEDGLHPSAQGYAKWEKVIFPEIYDLLK